MSGISVYFAFIKMNLKSGFQYKGWPLQFVNVLFTVVTDPIGVFLLFSRFGNIGEWTVVRIMLIYSMALTSFGLAELFSRGFDSFPWKIRSGEFDRALLRPRSAFTLILGSVFHLNRLSRVISGIIVTVYCLVVQGTIFNFGNVLMIFLAFIGGYLAYTGVFLMTSGLAFFTVASLDWIFIFTNASYQVTRCPYGMLPRWLKNMFTFFMPMFFFCYFPASAVCGWGEPYLIGYSAFPAGAAFFAFSFFIWRFGMRHYKSTGS